MIFYELDSFGIVKHCA